MLLFILGGVFMLGICIIVHELGHLLMGKAVGVKAEIFSVGYGRGIWKKKIGDTTWQITAIPLGGYVKFYGDDYANRTGEPGGFLSAPPLRRIIPVLGGPLFNLILGFFVFLLLHTFSGPMAPRIAISEELWQDAPAYRAGLRNGDYVRTINGLPVRDFYELRKEIALSKGKSVKLEVDRAGQTLAFDVKPDVLPSGTAIIGIRAPGRRYLEVNFLTKDVWAYRLQSMFSKEPPPRNLRALQYLRDGDVLLSVQGREVNSITALQRTLGEFHGQEVEVRVRRESVSWLAPWIQHEETVRVPTMGEYRVNLTGIVDEKYGAAIPDQMFLSHSQIHQRGLADVKVEGEPAGSFERLASRYATPKEVKFQIQDRTYKGTIQTEKIGLIGFMPADRVDSEYLAGHSSILEVLRSAARDTWDSVMLYPTFFAGLFSGRFSFVDNAMGPVGMFKVAGTVVKSGFQDYLQLLAGISIALMVMNLLPFPMVDGGHIVFFLYEAIAGEPVPLRVMDAMHRLAFSVLVVFGLFIMYKDVIFAFGF